MTVGDQPTRFDTLPPSGAPDALAAVRPEELAGASGYDLLSKALSEQVRLPLLSLQVPERPAVTVVFDPNFDDDELTAWRNRAMNEDPRLGVNAVKLASIVIANRAVEFKVHGRSVRLDGQPLTFASEQVWQMVKPPATGPLDAVKRLYAIDPHIISTGEEIVRAAGYGTLVKREEADPTVAPLTS
jgi:hypothetical protein